MFLCICFDGRLWEGEKQGKTQADFVQQLRGNTQASKIPRLMTRAVDPKRLAVWTVEGGFTA
ncbi:MAG: hypothetical protein JO215_13660, partial [Ktedonobacteraceae bacterium]|nr:hypothetical protein [Ktedonobacteraceae bacterium]